MIKLSTRGDYALKSIVFLIKNADRKVKIKEISKAEKMSESLLRRIIADLEKAGILTTYKGRNGGVCISDDLKSFSIYDILISVGEELGVSECSKGFECENSQNCSISPIYNEIQKGINGILKFYSLDKIEGLIKKES